MSTAKRALIFPAAALALLGGCRAARSSRLPDPLPAVQERTALMEAMNAMDRRRRSIDAIVARLNFVFHDRVKNRKLGLNGYYFGDALGNMRMRIKRGETVVVDLSYHGGQVDLFLPRKRRFSRGRRQDVRGSKNNVLALLAHVGGAPELFFPHGWTEQSADPLRIGPDREVVCVIKPSGALRKETRRFFINRKKPVCDRMEIFDEEQQLLGTVQYARYAFPGPSDGGRDERRIRAPYPRRVTLETPGGKRTLRMDVLSILSPPGPIPLDKFEIKRPKEMRIRDLGETLKSGKGLWD